MASIINWERLVSLKKPGFPGRFLFFLPAEVVEGLRLGFVSASGPKPLTEVVTVVGKTLADMTNIWKIVE